MIKFFKILGIILLILTATILSLYFYITNHAETLLKDFVSMQSKGIISLDVKKVRFSFKKSRLEIFGTHFYTSDSTNDAITYDIKADRLFLQLSDIKPLIFQRKLQMDTIICIHPQIVVNKWKQLPKSKFSLSGQMGMVYDGLNETLDNLDIKYCLVDSGMFRLNDKFNKEAKPVTITDYYLRIENLSRASTETDPTRLIFTDRIKFYSSHQDIQLPDGRHGIKYGSFRVNSQKKSIEIDSCYLYEKKSLDNFNEFAIYFDSLRLSNADFNELARNNIIKADSAVCVNPKIDFSIELKEKKKNINEERIMLSRDSMKQSVKSLLGDVNMKYIGLLNAQIDVKTKYRGRVNSYTTQRNNLILEDITIIDKPEVPLTIGGFSFDVYGYKAYDPDSMYSVTFDSVLFRNDKISLSNFSLTPTPRNTEVADKKEITMRSLQIEDISWMELFGNKRLDAGDVTMIDPEITINSPEKKQSEFATKKSIYRTFSGISQKVNISKLKIENGNLNYFTGDKKQFRFEQVNTTTSVDQLFQSRSINELFGSVNDLTFGSGTLFTEKSVVSFKQGKFNGKNQVLMADILKYNSLSNDASITLGGVRIDKFNQVSLNNFKLGNISWKEGYFILTSSKKIIAEEILNPNRQPLIFSLDKINGGKTSVIYNDEKVKATVHFDTIQTEAVKWVEKTKPVIENLRVAGDHITINSGNYIVDGGLFYINDQQQSILEKLKINVATQKSDITIKVPEISFKTDVSSIINGRSLISNVVMNNPEINFGIDKKSNIQSSIKNKGAWPNLNIDHIKIVNPKFSNLPLNDNFKLDLSKAASLFWLHNFHSDSSGFFIDRVNLATTGRVTGVTDKISFNINNDGMIEAGLENSKFLPVVGSNNASWSTTLKSLLLSKVEFNPEKDDTLNGHILLDSLRLTDVNLNSNEKLSIVNLFSFNKELGLNISNLKMTTPKNNVSSSAIQYNAREKKLLMYDFSVLPKIDREEFNRNLDFQTDYIQMTGERLVLSQFDPISLFSNNSSSRILSSKKADISNFKLNVYKDKRLPLKKGLIKSLPSVLLQQLKLGLVIDSLQLDNAAVTYEEVNEKTHKSALVRFDNINALFENINNHYPLSTDSLRLFATARFMDSAQIRLRFIESYNDSLHGFYFAARARPFNLSILNPILEPLVSVRISGGRIDTLRMNAYAREYLAHGKIKFFYHGLKGKYLPNGNEEKRTFSSRLINFAANNFVIRRNNTDRLGQVYAERNRERSVFNYWIKMLVSGIISSTGVQSNNKIEKKYNKSIKKLQLSDIPEVPL